MAVIGDNLEISGIEFGPRAYCLSAYLLQSFHATKVFSAHIASRSAIGEVWPYWEGRCRLLSWSKRGEWEQCIVTEQVEPRIMAHILHGGLARLRD